MKTFQDRFKELLGHLNSEENGLALELFNELSGKIIVDEKEYDNLWDRYQKLCALEGAGVDNWCGYDDAMDAYREMKGEEEDD